MLSTLPKGVVGGCRPNVHPTVGKGIPSQIPRDGPLVTYSGDGISDPLNP